MKNLHKRPTPLQKSQILVEFLAHCAMQYYTANAIFIGQTKLMSIFRETAQP